MENFTTGYFPEDVEYVENAILNENLLRPMLTDEFIRVLGLACQVIGWDLDTIETDQLVTEVCRIADRPVPSTAPFLEA